MQRSMLKSKLHRVTTTHAELHYIGSCAIDENLLDAAGILPFELVMISNLNNGERFTTYAMAGKRGSGEIVLNGPTARKAVVGDKVIIFCYEFYAEDEAKRHQPKIILVDDKNHISHHKPSHSQSAH